MGRRLRSWTLGVEIDLEPPAWVGSTELRPPEHIGRVGWIRTSDLPPVGGALTPSNNGRTVDRASTREVDPGSRSDG